MKIINIRKNKLVQTIYWILSILLIIVLILIFLSSVGIGNKFFFFVVTTGSMEPEIKPGSIVIAVPQNDYKVGDIISFSYTSVFPPENVITHRIDDSLELNGIKVFSTKGDANNISDFNQISTENIVGRVNLVIPYLGYLVNFAKTPLGFILLIVFPAIWIIIEEGINIKREISKRKKIVLNKA